jgi:hypothetical protein
VPRRSPRARVATASPGHNRELCWVAIVMCARPMHLGAPMCTTYPATQKGHGGDFIQIPSKNACTREPRSAPLRSSASLQPRGFLATHFKYARLHSLPVTDTNPKARVAHTLRSPALTFTSLHESAYPFAGGPVHAAASACTYLAWAFGVRLRPAGELQPGASKPRCTMFGSDRECERKGDDSLVSTHPTSTGFPAGCTDGVTTLAPDWNSRRGGQIRSS